MLCYLWEQLRDYIYSSYVISCFKSEITYIILCYLWEQLDVWGELAKFNAGNQNSWISKLFKQHSPFWLNLPSFPLPQPAALQPLCPCFTVNSLRVIIIDKGVKDNNKNAWIFELFKQQTPFWLNLPSFPLPRPAGLHPLCPFFHSKFTKVYKYW